MANPNIVSVTSIYGESIGEALTTTTDTDIMTVATNVVITIHSIIVTNTPSTNATAVTVGIRKAGFTSSGIGAAEDNDELFLIESTLYVPAE